MKDGPFADYTLKSGPGLFVTEHCLTRGINDSFAIYMNSSAVAYTSSLPTFEQFRVSLEGTVEPLVFAPHGGGHLAVGGEMTNPFSSPAGTYDSGKTAHSPESSICCRTDPLFFMHHTNLDRIWWRWQEGSPGRLYEISGQASIYPPYGNVTLNDPLKMGGVGPTIPLRDVMDTRKEPSCYTYV